MNSEQLLFNWQLGRDLVIKRAEEKWGRGVVEQVSLDLQAAFPEAKGFSARNLWFMKQWYTFYSSADNAVQLISNLENQIDTTSIKLKQVASVIQKQKLKQLDSEMLFPLIFAYVPWMHHVLIMQKCKSIEEALFYIQRTVEESLSRNALDNIIRADLYHSLGTAITNYDQRLPEPQGKLAQEWAFVGRQKEIIISGKTRKIDLLFYHIYLRCYVVLELKVKPFDPEYAGKLNFYVNAVNEFIRKDSDNPTIGLLICKDMDRTEVQLAFQGITTPMGVATYDNVKIKEIQEYLPTAEQIQQQIEIAEEEYRISLSEKKDR